MVNPLSTLNVKNIHSEQYFYIKNAKKKKNIPLVWKSTLSVKYFYIKGSVYIKDAIYDVLDVILAMFIV